MRHSKPSICNTHRTILVAGASLAGLILAVTLYPQHAALAASKPAVDTAAAATRPAAGDPPLVGALASVVCVGLVGGAGVTGSIGVAGVYAAMLGIMTVRFLLELRDAQTLSGTPAHIRRWVRFST